MKSMMQQTASLRQVAILVGAAALIGVAGCGNNGATSGNGATSDNGANSGGPGAAREGGGAAQGNLSGQIKTDGSSTVGPITQLMAEDFGASNSRVRITVEQSGTGGGLKKFANGDLEIANASRPIKAKEAAAAKAKNVEFIELPVAFDGLAIVVNAKNTWAKDLTTAELKKIWEPGAKGRITNWSQVRAGFPSKPLKLYGPGTASGTFDYFTDEIVGEEGSSRSDYTASEDDNVLVEGVSRDEGALGYFGFAYYEENKENLGLVSVDGVKPAPETITTNQYKPLSRPLFIYVQRKAADRPEVAAFVKYYLEHGKDKVREAGYVPLHDAVAKAALQRFEAKIAGSVYTDKAAKGKTLEQLFGAQ
ncbi:MAG: phosphate transport system substrate-binding protein [Abditibacteriota bacterium]|nr:phosphate transport system substrate-binding protein [Abditibacteriota bacterium]